MQLYQSMRRSQSNLQESMLQSIFVDFLGSIKVFNNQNQLHSLIRREENCQNIIYYLFNFHNTKGVIG